MSIHQRALHMLLTQGRMAYETFNTELSAPDFEPALAFPKEYQSLARALFRGAGQIVMPRVERELDTDGKKALNGLLATTYDNGARITAQHCQEVAQEVLEDHKRRYILAEAEALVLMAKTGQPSREMESRLNRVAAPLRAIGTSHNSTDAKDIGARTKENALAIARGQKTKGISMGFSKLDKQNLLMKAEVLGIFGPAKSGKTSLALAIAGNIAQRIKGLPLCVVIFSMEMTQEELFSRLAASRARFDLSKLGNEELKEDDPDFLRYLAELDEIATWPLKIEPRAGLSASDMATELERYTAEIGGVALAALDYTSLAKADKKTNSETSEVQAIYREYKAMVKNHVNSDGSNPAGLMVGELNRETGALPTRKHIKYAGDYELAAAITPVDPVEFKDDAGVMAFLENRKVYSLPPAPYQQERWIHVIFNRYGDTGTIDRFRFVGQHTRWEQGQWS